MKLLSRLTGSLFALAFASCSSTTTPAGLEVIVQTDLPASSYGSIWVQVSQQASSSLAFGSIVNEALSGPLPGRFAIAAGASSDQDVLIAVTAYATTGVSDSGPGTTPLVQRTEQVQVPKTYVGELNINLSASPGACPGTFQQGSVATDTPTSCTINLSDAGPLPRYQAGTNSFDAGTYDAAPIVDARRADTTVSHDSGAHDAGHHDAGHDSEADAGHDSGTHDAGHDAGADAPVDAGDASDVSTAPTLTNVSPNSGFAGDALSVVLTGTGFEQAAGSLMVQASNANIAISEVNVASDTEITATFTILTTAVANIGTVSVTTAKGTSGTVPFTVHGVWTVATDTDTASGTEGSGPGAIGDLRYTLLNSQDGDKVNLSCGGTCVITLGGPLPPLGHSLLIDGGGHSQTAIDGDFKYRAFFVEQGTVNLSNLTIQNAVVMGGAGGAGYNTGGGGGLGAGAGVFINSAQAFVTLTNVFFGTMIVSGGAGGDGMVTSESGGGGGGGGGLGFGGGAGSFSTTSGGAGGGGGGVLGQGTSATGTSGGVGGLGGGGAGSSFFGGLATLSGGTPYVEDAGGGNGTTMAAGVGGFGGGGGGGADALPGQGGGFGGGGGGVGSLNHVGGSGGPGGGGGAGTTAGPGGVLAASVMGGNGASYTFSTTPAGGGGGAAAGAAVFVRLGNLTYTNCASSEAMASPGAGGSGNATPGTADSNPIFNFQGTVNGSGTQGGITLPPMIGP